MAALPEIPSGRQLLAEHALSGGRRVGGKGGVGARLGRGVVLPPLDSAAANVCCCVALLELIYLFFYPCSWKRRGRLVLCHNKYPAH